MKIALSFAFTLAMAASANAQSVQQTLNAGGGSKAGNIYLDWSVGEMVAVQTFSSSNVLLTQGLLQPGNSLGSPLPVTLLFFNAKAGNKQTVLTWATAQEINSHHFEIERSTNAIHFETLKTVMAAGNSSHQKNYSAVDSFPVAGVNFYRLKQVDNNGKACYSAIVGIHQMNEMNVLLYPNPASDVITLQRSDVSENGTLEIFNTSGKLLKRLVLPAGTATERIALNEYASGTYVIRVKTASQELVMRFVKR
ncbi:MAG: T9SS type A sorting domain-containing protein [Chitinophagaceae bacterium]